MAVLPSTPARPIMMLPGERMRLDMQPAPASVVIQAGWWLVACATVAGVGLGAWLSGRWGTWGANVALVAVLVALVVLMVEAIRRRLTRFVLTDRRIAATTGVLIRKTAEIGPPGVRHIALRRSILERIFGLGTIGVSTAGAPGFEVVWWNIAEPEASLSRLREGLAAWNPTLPVRIDVGARSPAVKLPPSRAEARIAAVEEVPKVEAPPHSEPAQAIGAIPVIGLAGGIGAGKSYVAGLFARLGCYVVDSDSRAKAALDRAEVRDELVRWWGERVLGQDGRIDRAEIAKIVFADPEQRQRLEALVHPLVRQDRARLISEAAAFWPKAIVIDAPLLFEAGVDKECDAVLFVAAPAEERARRVHETRGWDEAELARREAAQWPLDRKRAASHYVLENTGPEADILNRAARVLESIREATAGPVPAPR